MPNKRLGRGLQDISDVFLSEGSKNDAFPQKEPPLYDQFDPDVSCQTCVNFISACSRPTCRIFTFDFERYGVPYLAEINPARAGSCRYYQLDKTDEKTPGMANVNDIRIEESLYVTRKMAVKKNAFIQKNMRKIVFDHLEEGYEFKRIIMEKQEHEADQKKTLEVDVFVADGEIFETH